MAMKDFAGVHPGDKLLMMDLGPGLPRYVQHLYNTVVTVRSIHHSKIGSYYYAVIEEYPIEAFQASCFANGFRMKEYGPVSEADLESFLGI